MKHLTKFDTLLDYYHFKGSSDYAYPNVSYIEGTKEIKYDDNQSIPFYVEALEDMTLSTTKTTVEYSWDLLNWETLAAEAESPIIPANNRLYFKANPSSSFGHFYLKGKCNVGGNIMSLLYGDDFIGKLTIPFKNAFDELFYYQSSGSPSYNINRGKLISAEDLVLPAIHLSEECYRYMFYSSDALIKTPRELPATKVSKRCYRNMFALCENIEEGPATPILFEQITYGACQGMYSRCTNLKRMSPIYSQVADVNFESSSYTYSCGGMYANCANLNYIVALFIRIGYAESYQRYGTDSWVNGVAEKGVFVKNAEATWDIVGTSGVPSGWEVKLYDTNTKRTFVRFNIGDSSYEADDGMTWEEWVVSDYNTAGISIDGTSLITDAGTLMLGDTAVLPTDLVTCIAGTDYSIVASTENETTEA